MERNLLSIDVDLIQDFSYVLPRIYSEKSKLLTVENYENLAKSKDLHSFFEKMNKTQYSLTPIIDGIQPRDVEKFLKNVLLEFSYTITDLAPKISNRFIRAYLSIYDLINLKIALRLKALGFKEEQILSNLPIPLERLKSRSIFLQVVRLKDLNEVLSLLDRLDFFHEPSFEAIRLSERFQESYLIESYIDKWYFTSIFDECVRLSDFDRKNLLQIIGVEVDAYNLLATTRGKNLGFSGEVLRACIVPRQYNVGKKSIEQIIEGEASFYEVIEDSGYCSLLPDLHTTLEEGELAFRKLIFNASKQILLQIPFQTGILLSILKLKEFEIGNLLAIMYGLDFEFEPNEILQQLIM